MKKLCLFLVLALLGLEVAGRELQSSTRVPLSSSVTTVTTPSTTTLPTTSISSVQDCIRTCPVTSEFNPVCGSNSVTYENPGRLLCAQACGVNVNLLRMSRCPPPTPAPSA